ncbi:MAG TPA: hypothetical protein VGM94_06650 [Galbitalea sp.]
MPRASDIDPLLEDTVQPSAVRRSRSRRRQQPTTPPLIAQWKAEQKKPRWFGRWATSQVAGYRMELIVGYLTLVVFGGAAVAAGIPIFSFTTPAGFTPIWGSLVMVGGLVAAIGALRAGEVPLTRTIKVFNWIELWGTVALFLALTFYAGLLIIIGSGAFSEQRIASDDTATHLANLARVAVGCAILALSSHPTVRMVWLFFRPGKILTTHGEVSEK